MHAHICMCVLTDSKLVNLPKNFSGIKTMNTIKTVSCSFNANESEGVGLMIFASTQIHCITLSTTTSDYLKGFSVTFGNPDIYSVLLVIAQSCLSQLLIGKKKKKNDFFSIVDKKTIFSPGGPQF